MSESIDPPSEPTHKTGIIGFFDILGYQSFLENNDVGLAVNAVLEALQMFPQVSREGLKKLYALLPEGHEQIEGLLSQTEHLIFSDTILVTSPYQDVEDMPTKLARWFLFVMQSAILQRKMFDYGLPIRGMITFGNYILKNACFAGRPIIEAYRIGSSIDVSAVVFSEAAEHELQEVDSANLLTKILSYLAVPYPIPLKNGVAPRLMKTLNFAQAAFIDQRFLMADNHQLVQECFGKHNKSVPPPVFNKVTNTAQLLGFLRAHKGD